MTRLAAHLDEHGSPIDYDRRRALDYTEQRWNQLLDRAELHHTPALLRVVRGVLFETLSSKPSAAGPPAAHPPTSRPPPPSTATPSPTSQRCSPLV